MSRMCIRRVSISIQPANTNDKIQRLTELKLHGLLLKRIGLRTKSEKMSWYTTQTRRNFLQFLERECLKKSLLNVNERGRKYIEKHFKEMQLRLFPNYDFTNSESQVD